MLALRPVRLQKEASDSCDATDLTEGMIWKQPYYTHQKLGLYSWQRPSMTDTTEASGKTVYGKMRVSGVMTSVDSMTRSRN